MVHRFGGPYSPCIGNVDTEEVSREQEKRTTTNLYNKFKVGRVNFTTTSIDNSHLPPYPHPLAEDQSTMPSVLLKYTAFAEGGLKPLYTSTTKKAFDDAFEAFFDKHLEVTYNGKKTTRAHFKQMLWDEKHDERRGTVNYVGSVEVDDTDKNPITVSPLFVVYKVAHIDAHHVERHSVRAPEGGPLLRSRREAVPVEHHRLLQA